MSIPRPEFPNPQAERENWLCLNGQWDFEFDFGKSMQDDGEILKKEKWDKEITVPFCPESELSGIGYKDFIPAVWYRKKIEITEENLKGRVFICFGAVDYYTTVYVNGKKVDIPSYLVKPGDVIALTEKSKASARTQEIAEANAARVVPKWLDMDKNNKQGKVIALPARDDIDYEVEEHLIVELYSK